MRRETATAEQKVEILNRLDAERGQWVDMGLFTANKKRRHLIAEKSVLRGFMDHGYVTVRTVDYSVWTPQFDKTTRDAAAGYRKRTRRVEAMITAEGIKRLETIEWYKTEIR